MNNHPKFMKGSVHFEPENKKILDFVDPQKPFESVAEFFGYPLGRDQRRRSKVACKDLIDTQGNRVTVYFKLYGYRRLKRVLSRILKPSRSKSELKNLRFFHQIGIPACTPILQGEYRNIFGITRNCMLITLAIENTTQLDEFILSLQAGNDDPSTKTDIINQIISSVATNLRKIHDLQFYHDDLKWRNILVRRTEKDPNQVEVFWIDCPNGYFDRTGGYRHTHGKIKDLTTMYHDALKNHIPKESCLLFLSVYSGLELKSAELNNLAKQVHTYWDTKFKK